MASRLVEIFQREHPPCEWKTGLRKYKWMSYQTFSATLRDMGVRAKPWVVVGLGFARVCCKHHDPNEFDDGRRFQIVSEAMLVAYDADRRLAGARRRR